MKLGEIYYFTSNQALGYQARPKYHVYVCDSGWVGDGHAFLFISSANYGGDLRISKPDYPFLTYDVSYVSCGNPVFYSDEYLASVAPRFVAALKPAHVRDLYKLVLDSETMEGRYIKLVGGALKDR